MKVGRFIALAQPARSLDDLTSDPSRLRRDEERNNGRDIAWLADSTEWRSSQKHRINLVSVRHRPVTFGLYRPWEHGVHENLPRPKFRREAPGDDVYGALACTIDRCAGRRIDRCNRANIYDRAAMVAHGAGCSLRGEQQTLH